MKRIWWEVGVTKSLHSLMRSRWGFFILKYKSAALTPPVIPQAWPYPCEVIK